MAAGNSEFLSIQMNSDSAEMNNQQEEDNDDDTPSESGSFVNF